MKKFYLLILCALFASGGFSQIQLISASNGGFEAGTLATNGWTEINDLTNKWEVGTATKNTGINSAYISIDAGLTYTYLDATANVSHFYRDIPVPAGAKNITLSFYYRGNGEFPASDRLTVYTAPTSVLPAAGSLPGVGSTQVFPQTAAQDPLYGFQTIPLPVGLAGTSVRLIFTWENNGNLVSTDPPASVDDVSFTYCIDPNVTNTLPDPNYCNGAAGAGITFTSDIAGATFTWTSSTDIGFGSGGNGNIPNYTTSNPTTAPVTTTLSVTASDNGCTGPTTNYFITVNPTATAVATPASQPAICSGAPITTIVLTSSTSGATLNWTRDNTGGTITGLPASGSGDISGNLTNTTTAPITVTFTITPSINGCNGTATTATVIVNPTPNAVATPASQTKCTGSAITNIVLSGSVTGTTYAWTRDNTVSVTGMPASGNVSPIAGTLTNGTTAPVTVTFTITPTANSCPGAPITATVLVNNKPVVTALPTTQTVCSGVAIAPINLSSTTVGATFSWNRSNPGTTPGITVPGSGTPITGTLTQATALPITSTFTILASIGSPACTGSAVTSAVIVNPSAPSAPGAITGAATQCPAVAGLTYSVTAVFKATTYTWTVPAGWNITAGAGTNSITVTSGATGQNGNITVTAGNSCGTSAASSQAVTVSAGTPAVPGAITGTTPQCPAVTGQIYSIVAVPNATTYTWTVPAGWSVTAGAGTASITVTTGATGQNGNITVTAGNTCGTSAANSLAVTVGPGTPAVPGAITGTTPQCPAVTGQIYTIAAVPNATTYTWTVPAGWNVTAGAGTTSITVTTGATGQNGNITVTAGNTCGTSAASTKAVTVGPGTPAVPGAITGTTPQCPAVAGQIYTITAVPNATTYTWTVPAGWNVTAGAGTTSITVTTGATGQNGNITVTAGNTCGTSAASTKAVTVGPGTPAVPGAITGTTPQCPAVAGQIYTIAAVPNATTYTWTVPAGWTITAGAGTVSITVTTGATGQNGNITVTAGNTCGNSAAQTLAVTVGPGTPAVPGAITGTTPQCPAATGQIYSIAAVPNATTYTWTVPTGWSITAGAGTTSITVTTGATGQNGNITVTAGNTCGTSAARTLAVTVIAGAPATPGTITGTATQCPAATGQVYSIAAVATATTYTWTVPTGWTITAGAGTISITVTTGGTGQNGNITVTAGNSCGTSAAKTLAVTVAALPTVVTTTPGSRCGPGTVNIGATASAGATIDWYAGAVGGAVLAGGTGTTTFTTPSIAAPTTYYAQARNTTTGCISSARSAVIATVNPNPTVYNVTGGGAYCTGGAGVPVGLSNSQPAASNVTYQLFRGATPVGAAVAGTNAPIAFGNQTVAGTYTVVATNTVTTCSSPMNGSVVVTINNPTITSVTANPTTVCLGGTVNLVALPTAVSNIISENFEGASTFTIVNSGTAAKQWNLRTSPYTYTGTPVTISSGSKFMVAVADSGSVFGSVDGSLVSPIVNTTGFTSLTLTYNMYYRALGDDVFVEVSTNGGGSWTQVFDHTSTVGAPTVFSAQSINLNGYVNNANFRVRFRYNSGFGYYVAIDDIVLKGVNPYNYSWTSTAGGGLTAAHGVPNTANGNITVTPTTAGSKTYTATLTDGIGCVSPTMNTTITVNPSPIINTQPIDAVGCVGDTLSFTASVTGISETYQWRRGVTPLVNSAHINGANTATLTVNTLVVGDQGNDYNLVITNGNTCAVTTVNVSLTVNQAIVITSQPVDRSICAGAGTTFAVTTSQPGYTYQWRRGEIDIVNGGVFSGATTPTLTITGATSAEQDSAYNVVITGNCIAPEISNYVSLTVTNAAVTPTNSPSFLLFPAVNPTSVVVSFTPSSDATNYLIIIKNNGTPPPNPVDGTTYVAGTGTFATGRVEYAGTNNFVTSNGLSPNVNYCYWIYPFNKSTCGTATKYKTTAVLTGCVTTSTVNACGTPIAALYWAGTSSTIAGNPAPTTNFNTASNWSTAAGSYAASPVAPAGCNDVFVRVNNDVYIKLSANSAVNNLTYTVQGNGNVAILSVEGNKFVVNGDADIDAITGNNATKLYIGEWNLATKGYLDFQANVNLGATAGGGISHFVGHTGTKITFRGDMVLGQRAGIDNNNGGTYFNPAGNVNFTPDTTEFDGPGLQQVTWNNNQFYANFRNVVVGNQNNPVVRHVYGSFVADNIINNLTINGSSVLDLSRPRSQWNRVVSGGTLRMNGTSKLLLGLDKSEPDGIQGGVLVTGSNFPGGFATTILSPTSTIEYNGVNTITQTVYAIPGPTSYANLTLTNGTGPLTLPLAPKITTATVTVLDSLTVNSGVNFTPGTGVVINQGVAAPNGGFYVNNNATLTCGTNTISGTGTFNLLAGGNLWIGAPLGITALPSGAGNITTTGARNFSTAANYTYYGIGALVTGNGLPFTMNNLTINNNAGITMNPAGRNYTVAGTLTQIAGPLVLNGDTLSINKLTRNSGTFTGSPTSSIGIIGVNQNTPLFFTAGARILKDLFLNNNATAVLGVGQKLDIAGGAAPGSITVGSAATLTGHDSLTLKSDALGTARVGPIPQDGSGNALGFITGNVGVERYYPGRRAWRLITAPVSTTRTIYQQWQINGVMATQAPGSGTLITKPFGTGVPTDGLEQSLHYSLKTFNQATGALVDVLNTKVAISGNARTLNVPDNKGYFMFVRGDRTPSLLNPYPITNYNITTLRDTGALQTGKKTFGPVAASQFMLVGNPYASPIDFGLLVRTNIPKKFWAWSPRLNSTLGAYVIVDGQTGPYIITPAPDPMVDSLGQDQYIHSSQAVFVQAAAAGSGTVEFNESAKTLVNKNKFFRPVADSAIYENLRVNLYLADPDTAILADGVYSQFHNDFSSEIDGLDGLKFTNFLENFGILSHTKTLILERRPLIAGNDTIFFKLWNTTERNYQFRFISNDLNHPGLEAFLEDNYTKAKTPVDLNGYTTISFSITGDGASKAINRFMLVFKDAAGGPLPLTFTTIKAAQQNSNINVEWNVSNEININQYEVERSSDGVHFIKVGSVTATGNGRSISYQWPDENVGPGTYYYRIRSISNNGEVKYSAIVKVTIGSVVPRIFVYPNPVIAGGDINIHFINQPLGKYGIRLLNKIGQLIAIKQVEISSVNSTETLPFNKALAHGAYQLDITRPDGSRKNIALIY